MVSATSFGALPIQRVSFAEAGLLLRKAFDNGVNFFDTANAYSDSEEKIGAALSDVRHEIILATKSGAQDKKTLLSHIELSLRRMKTDYIDLIQLHNPAQLPDPDDMEGTYQGLLEAQQRGWVRFFGVTNHSLNNARLAVTSGLYDTIQYPFSSLASPEEVALTALAKEHDVGFIAMKGLAGGLITNAATTFSFIRQYDNVVPIWGVQRERELDEFLQMEQNPPEYDAAMQALVEQDRAQLMGNFCRACGYCKPCPAGIEIPTAARMSLLLRRAPYRQFLTDEQYAAMRRIEACTGCGACKSRCPYHLDTPELLRQNLADYLDFYESHRAEL